MKGKILNFMKIKYSFFFYKDFTRKTHFYKINLLYNSVKMMLGIQRNEI